MNKLKTMVLSASMGTFMVLSNEAFALQSFGDVAKNLMGPTFVITKIMDIFLYILGFIFIFMSIAQYKIHRQNPKLVPLVTPMVLFVFGVVALFLPYLTTKFETGKNYAENPNKVMRYPPPLPPNSHEAGPGMPPHTGTQTPSDRDYTKNAPNTNPKDKHWTQEPKYQNNGE